MARPRRFSAHDNIEHGNADGLAYDWDLAANPEHTEPKRPFRVYLPETTAEVRDAIREARALPPPPTDRPRRIRVRSRGHSSNHLVLGDRDDVVLWTAYLTGIEKVDRESDSVWVQAGVVLADLDEHLAEEGYGLPVIGDHNHITAGGFASVGGVSPASNKRGIFIDNILAVEWVDWDGVEHRSGREDEAAFYSVIGGLGAGGVITRLHCRVLRIDKKNTILENDRAVCCGLERFVAESRRRIEKAVEEAHHDPGGFGMERGLWLDFPKGPFRLQVGQYSTYAPTRRTWWKARLDALTHGFLHWLGSMAGELRWSATELLVQAGGVAGLIFSPKYASVKNIEVFADKILDTGVGDPHRMFIVFGPAAEYEVLFRGLNDICLEYRERGCVTFILIYVKSISSEYLSLAHGSRARVPFCELVLWLGLRPDAMAANLDEMVGRLDRFCRSKGAFRYMHTRTVPEGDPLRAEIDPNQRVLATLKTLTGE